ncbi:MAG: hypothetical protein GW778_03585 [Alphaproteobacteria bacterium]|nr:hypothetical protein [Alphaproteobacteria bacterium]
MRENYKVTLCVGFFAFIGFSTIASAQNTDQQNLFIPSVYTLDNAWNTQKHDFTQTEAVPIILDTQDAMNIADAQNKDVAPNADKNQAAFKSKDDEDWEDKLLDKLPYKNTLKYTWKIIDGKENIYFEGLRVDRGNKGLEYRTQDVPFIGKVDALKMRAEIGESSNLIFESDYIPLLGRKEGFNFKATAGSDSNVSIRYKTSFP